MESVQDTCKKVICFTAWIVTVPDKQPNLYGVGHHAAGFPGERSGTSQEGNPAEQTRYDGGCRFVWE